MFRPIGETIHALTKNWWLFVLRGCLTILFGVLIIAWPLESVLALAILFGIYALADGILSVILAFAHRGDSGGRRAWLILWGIVGIGAGIVVLAWPAITALALLYVIAFWAFIAGIVQLAFAFLAKTSTGNRVWLALGGVFSLIFGGVIAARPDVGALAVVWIIATFALMAGVFLIAFGLNLRDLKKDAAAPAK